MIIFFSIPAVMLWSLANYVGRLSGDGKGKTSSEIIQDFGGFILKHAPDAGTKFYDEKKLPYKKERIKEALVAGISHAYKTGDINNLNALENALCVTLQHFQKGIGKNQFQWHLKLIKLKMKLVLLINLMFLKLTKKL